MKTRAAFFLIPALLLSAAAFAAPAPEEAASRILRTLERRLPGLPVDKQGHLAIRLWRATGDDKYLPFVRAYGNWLEEKFARYAAASSDPAEAARISRELSRVDRTASEKLRRRAESMRTQSPAAAFDRRLLFLAYQIHTLGLEKGKSAGAYSKALAYLERVDWNAFLLDADVIRSNATRVTNAMHYLEELGIAAPREDFDKKFKEVFFGVPDEKLDRVAFLNKIYGLTHLVIAGSDFYQRPVSGAEHGWILEYFSAHFDEIAYRANPDAVAEIAVCFRLAGKPDDPIVGRVQRYVLAHYEARHGAILKRGNADPEETEHRNIVAYLALQPVLTPRKGPSAS